LKIVVKLKYIILAKAVVTPAAPELGDMCEITSSLK